MGKKRGIRGLWARVNAPMPVYGPQNVPPEQVVRKTPKPLRPFPVLDLGFPGSPGFQTVGRGYIYALVDPRDSTVRYVGYSRSPNLRFRQHEAAENKNDKLRAWQLDLIAARLAPRMVILTRAEKNWEIHERRWIKYYRLRGRLYNRHQGGRHETEPQPDMPQRLKKRLEALRLGVTRDARGRKP